MSEYSMFYSLFKTFKNVTPSFISGLIAIMLNYMYFFLFLKCYYYYYNEHKKLQTVTK